MRHLITVPIYRVGETGFQKVDETIYYITYARTNKKHRFKINVNGKESVFVVNLLGQINQYGHNIRMAMSHYKNGLLEKDAIQNLDVHELNKSNNKEMSINLERIKLIKAINSRDKQFKYNLIQ